jgi:hypothetical protein
MEQVPLVELSRCWTRSGPPPRGAQWAVRKILMLADGKTGMGIWRFGMVGEEKEGVSAKARTGVVEMM